jgi:hypothetical protein
MLDILLHYRWRQDDSLASAETEKFYLHTTNLEVGGKLKHCTEYSKLACLSVIAMEILLRGYQ